MSGDHATLRTALGAYVLGALEPSERAAVSAHLAACAACRDEVAGLAALPGLLGRLSPEEAREGLLTPRPGLAEAAVAATAHRQRGQRRVLRAWQAVAAAALVLLVIVVAGGPLRDGGEQLVAEAAVTAASDVSGTATMTGKPWGTAIALDIAGLPRRSGYVLVAVTAADERESAAWWGPTRHGRARLGGACSFDEQAITSLEIADADGDVLVRFPRPRPGA